MITSAYILPQGMAGLQQLFPYPHPQKMNPHTAFLAFSAHEREKHLQ